MRADGRKPDELRQLEFEPDYLEQPHGSALVTQGKTIVLCTAMIQEEVPRWLRNQGRGWITAEYSLLPASTGDRVDPGRRPALALWEGPRLAHGGVLAASGLDG